VTAQPIRPSVLGAPARHVGPELTFEKAQPLVARRQVSFRQRLPLAIVTGIVTMTALILAVGALYPV
jgi:hypothetical protein